jgi:N-acetylglucosaminyldiphosphoundecaprenol N-acetyl-beta-D-mannosaminyltransferase
VNKIEHRDILGVRIDATAYARATRDILTWAREPRSCYVVLATVNNIMEARRSPEYARVMHEAALATPDGMPLVWLLRRLGARDASRVYGPDLMPMVLAAASEGSIPVGFYGGSPEVLMRLRRAAARRFPALTVAYAFAPPFREATPAEDAGVTQAINASGARILFVGLGSPKQDRWMHAHRGSVHAVMLGVGAAFDYFAGTKPQAPRWMQSSGLEWAFRLAIEPRRLWRRYLAQNPVFAALALAQLCRVGRAPSPPPAPPARPVPE